MRGTQDWFVGGTQCSGESLGVEICDYSEGEEEIGKSRWPLNHEVVLRCQRRFCVHTYIPLAWEIARASPQKIAGRLAVRSAAPRRPTPEEKELHRVQAAACHNGASSARSRAPSRPIPARVPEAFGLPRPAPSKCGSPWERSRLRGATASTRPRL